MSDSTRKQWFNEHLGIFSGSAAHRLMANIEDNKMLEGERLNVCMAIIDSLPPQGFSDTSGLPYVAIVNSLVPDDVDDTFSALEVKYAFKKLNPLTTGLKGYAREKAVQIIQGFVPSDGGYQSGAMADGSRLEAESVRRFSVESGMQVEGHGEEQLFLRYPDSSIDLGATSDGLIFGKNKIDAILESKSRMLSNHYHQLQISGNESLFELEKGAFYQMQAEMACAEAGKGYYILYCPIENPEYKHLEFKYTEISRDESVIKNIVERVKLAMIYRDEYLVMYNRKGNLK